MFGKFQLLVATPARSAAFQGLFAGAFWFVAVLLGVFDGDPSVAGATVSALLFGALTGLLQWRILRRMERRATGSAYVALGADDRVEVVRAGRDGRPVNSARLAAAVVERVEQGRPLRSSAISKTWVARLVFLVVGGASAAALLLLLDDGLAATVFALLVGAFWATMLLLSFTLPTWRDPAIVWERADRADAEARRLLDAEAVS